MTLTIYALIVFATLHHSSQNTKQEQDIVDTAIMHLSVQKRKAMSSSYLEIMT